MPCPFVTLITRIWAQCSGTLGGAALLLALTVALTGCAEMNPFSTPTNPEAAVYSQFSDIPVPKDMSTNANRTFVNYGQDGTKVGMETLEGRIPSLTLTRVMINNMLRDGWSIRATSSGASRYMQVYERDNRYAVLYYYDQTASYAMEIWVATRLADGAVPPPPPLADPTSNVPVYHGNSDGSSGGMTTNPNSASAGAGGMSGTGGTGSTNSSGVQERSLP